MTAGATELAVARSGLYKLLSIGYSRPTEDLYQFITSGGYEKAVREVIRDIPWDRMQGQALRLLDEGFTLGAGSFQEYESLYISTFDVGMPRPPCPLCEGWYSGGSNRSRVLHEVLTFYRAFGLSLSEKFQDLHDHIVAELEFMHFLTFKEGQAGREESDCAPYLRAQRDFIERHLGTMFPRMRVALETVLKEGFFLALTRLAELFITCDRGYVSELVGARDLPTDADTIS
jgi:DMSO reductase family type II enzyme chaperone